MAAPHDTVGTRAKVSWHPRTRSSLASSAVAMPGSRRGIRLARLAVASRPGAGDPAMEFLAGAVAAGRVDVVDMPEVPISSTDVRARIAAGEDVSHLVPAPVAALLHADTAS